MPDSEVPMASPVRGRFQAIDSFAIRRRNEFYIIGLLQEGEVQEQWFAHIALNPGFAITFRITQIETVQIANETQEYQLLIVAGDAESIDLMLGLNIGLEPIVISTEGED
ncbi:hypothetical protein [Hymenobacter antarcticus]|uniref:Uncharacterized protein n=1 Tax=Hymenobacter antarcticus TaxID=486270 RepID=A0ABP7PQ19_9BACT